MPLRSDFASKNTRASEQKHRDCQHRSLTTNAGASAVGQRCTRERRSISSLSLAILSTAAIGLLQACMTTSGMQLCPLEDVLHQNDFLLRVACQER